jgi:hypothetical protein
MTKKNKKDFGSKTKILKKKSLFDNKPVLLIMLKSLIIVIGFFCMVRYLDTKGYFNPDESNNHSKKKWDSYYEFTKENNVDVVLVGNSHLYSGINPKNLSNALGCNAFILASPGTNLADSYYCLKEALKRSKAKLVVVETYGIRNFDPYDLNKSGLSNQFKSFYARKDFLTKMTSLPFLFSPENYLYAWSNTLRNHDFIFNDTTQFSLNKKLIKRQKRNNKKNNKLYLGRFVRFKTGIESSVMNKYDSLGAPVKGKEYTYNYYTEEYVNKTVSLCKKEGVELIFLTLPMYEKHISDYTEWKEKISEIIGKDSYNWIDMQELPNYNGFGPFAFENTYNKNQHMTYNGSLLATYKLADYIRDTLKIDLPNRSKDSKWTNLFYGEEGYFENFNPVKNDQNNKIICSNKILRNVKLNSILHLDIGNKTRSRIIAKVDKKLLKNLEYKEMKLRIALKFEIEGKEQIANLDLMYDRFHRSKDEAIFISMIKSVTIKEVVDGMLFRN